MNARALLASAAVLALGAPAWAQEAGDRARLDDFAVPHAQIGSSIEQIGQVADSIGPESTIPSDRQLTVPGPAAMPRVPVPQLSGPDDGGPTRQLSDANQSRDVAAGSVSSSRDSRPQPTAALAGSDRCDPQADTAQADCARILERRAAEFDAVEPPRLSAEQVLLAASDGGEDRLAASSSRARVRLASTGDPDADLQSNQEVAAIYLRRTETAPREPEDSGSATLDDARLAEVLQTLQILVPGGSAP